MQPKAEPTTSPPAGRPSAAHDPDPVAKRLQPRRIAHPLARLLLGGALLMPAMRAFPALDEATRALLVTAVEAASAVDFYNARCRGAVSGRALDDLNKLVVGKLRTTVLSIQDDFFPEQDYRRTQQRLEQDFAQTLRDAGGCPGAKESALPERLRARHQEQLDAIRALP